MAGAQRSETLAVYIAGIIQGLALVTFPAAGSIFTGSAYYGLSSTAYGGMFLPQAVTAVTASLLGAGLTRRLGVKRIYLAGLCADLAAMALLIVSAFVMKDRSVAYPLLLAATASLGVGFGLTVPALNTLAGAFSPQAVDRAVLLLNALLGLGTALAPALVALFVDLHLWWGLPVLVAGLLVGLLLFSLRLPLAIAPSADTAGGGKTAFPARFWIYAGFALLYGVVETMNGNWATVFMTRELGASTVEASLALTLFWGMVTAGRLLFAAVGKWLPPRLTFHLLPFVAGGAFVAIDLLPAGLPAAGVFVFGLAGLGCSALLPLTISFGQQELTSMAAAVAGALIACYQLGYGIAAFGVGPLENLTGLSLTTIYGATTVVALAMAAVGFAVTSTKGEHT